MHSIARPASTTIQMVEPSVELYGNCAAEKFARVSDDISDVELVDLVVRKYPGAFRRFYQRHSQLVYACIRKRANAADVDDVFQAFFERLVAKEFRALQMWQRGTSLPIYLAKVVRNFVVDFYRSKKFREEAVGGPAEIEAFLDPQEETLSLKGHLKELRRLGIQAWAVLDKRDRVMLCDRLHRDRTNDEIAGRLQLTPGALRTALSRAQARLLNELKTLAPEFFPDSV
jgi:RNA polymerase sigma factor (sigma-70 family)